MRKKQQVKDLDARLEILARLKEVEPFSYQDAASLILEKGLTPRMVWELFRINRLIRLVEKSNVRANYKYVTED